jgi:uncharacterized membrane protein
VVLLVRWVHFVSAMTRAGGMLFIALVLVPVAGLRDETHRLDETR